MKSPSSLRRQPRVFLRAMFLLITGACAAATIPNPSFEADTFPNDDGYVSEQPPGVTITGWAANPTNRVGINPSTENGNPLANNGAVPNGTHVAFVRSTGGGTSSISTIITGLTVGTYYRVQFRANAKSGTTPAPSYRLNGGAPMRFAVSPVGGTNAYFTISGIFFATATTAPLAISNTTTGDSTLLVDNFTISSATAIQVTNLNDSGAGSLRAALASAAATPAFNVITFAPSNSLGLILLNSELPINDAGGLAIDGSMAPGVAIHGPLSGRGMNIAVGSPCILRNLSLEWAGTTSSGQSGGAVLNAGVTQMLGCALHKNSAAFGGAIFNNSSGQLAMERCTVDENVAQTSGAGIYNQSGGVVRLNHCTISSNGATSRGGGVDNLGVLVVENTILYANIAIGAPGTLEDIYNDGTSGGGKINRIGANVIKTITHFNGGSDDGGGTLITTDPGLGTRGPNGGPTPTRSISSASVACNAAVGSTILADQRGNPIVGTADIGAFEVQAGRFFLSATSYRTAEGSSVSISVYRSGETSGTVTVRLRTSDGSATSPADYAARPNTVASDILFPQGLTGFTTNIPTVGDFLVEGNQTFVVTLSIPTPTVGATLDAPQSATVTIVDPIQVTNVNDEGPGSLRRALSTAEANTGGDNIHFSSMLNGKTIVLGGEVDVQDPGGVTIDASNLPAGLTIDGGPGKNRIFDNHTSSKLSLTGLTLIGGGDLNAATQGISGGAISNMGTLSLTRCTLFGNAGVNGGAIMNLGGTMSLWQCTVSGNRADDDGGGIFTDAVSTLTHCTITNNSAADLGDGILQGPGGTLTLDRCIVAGNPPTADFDISNGGTIVRFGTSIVPVVNPPGTITGTGNISGSDPKLDILANNGGPTLTHALKPGSFARDTALASSVASDQRGFPLVGAAPDIGAFEVQSGGTFVMSQTGYAVDEGAQATVTIKRLGGFGGTASVRLFTTSGTAMGGPAGDFSPRVNDAGSAVSFADGDVEKSVFIGTSGNGGVEANETFTVTLGTPSPGTSLGSLTSASVVIVDSLAINDLMDATDPGVPSITSPPAGGFVDVDGNLVTVTGTASDNVGVASVIADINGVNLTPLNLAKPGAPSTAFSGVVDGAGYTGANQVVVRVKDFAQNEKTATRTFRVRTPLLVNVSGNGSVTSGFVQKSYREVGRPYSITATAGSDAIFAGWTILSGHTVSELGISDLALEKAGLTFVHRAGLVLRASFVSNPFTPSVVGPYCGRVIPSVTFPDRVPRGNPPGPEDGTRSAMDTEGYVSLTIQSTGAFSGTLKLDGMALALAGTFDAQGTGRFGTSRARTLNVPRPGKPSLEISLFLNAPGGRVDGQVWQSESGEVSAMSEVHVSRPLYSATNNLPLVYLGTLGGNGLFTMIIEPGDAGGLGTDRYPQGIGTGNVTLSKTGTVDVVATLSDGTPISMSTFIGFSNTWRLYASIYGNEGAVTGNVQLDSAQASSDQSGGVVWFRPIQDKQHYPAGWRDGIRSNVRAAKYTVTAGTSVLAPLPVPGLDGNFNVYFNTASPRTILIDNTDKVTNTPSDGSFSITINRNAGTFTGSFSASNETKPIFNGVIFQKGTFASPPGGYGFFLTTTPTPKDYTGRAAL